MRAALGLARRGIGAVWPNPAVGCVIVENRPGGHALGRGWTQPGGRPHAETEALRRAGAAARGAIAYISLEPCNHYGRTPPCTEALITAGVARVVVAAVDPDPRVSGAGIERLRKAGVDVTVGVCEDEAREVNAGFFKRTTAGRPLVTLKYATSLDGRIATGSGQSKWITGEAARARSHLLRAEADAILVGTGTALADDPQLTCRLPGMAARSPVRIVMDSRLSLPLDGFLVASARDVPTWIVTLARGQSARTAAPYEERGVTIIVAPADAAGHPDVAWTAAELGRRGLTRLLVEAGAKLGAAWLRSGLVDRLAWLRAPMLIGGDGIPVTEAIGTATLADAPVFVRLGIQESGADIFESYRQPN